MLILKKMSENKSDVILQYFAGELDVKERDSLFEAMAHDESLKNEFDSYRQAFDAIDIAGRKELKQKLNIAGKQSDVKIKSRNRILFVGLLALLLVFCFWLRNVTKSDTNIPINSKIFPQNPMASNILSVPEKDTNVTMSNPNLPNNTKLSPQNPMASNTSVSRKDTNVTLAQNDGRNERIDKENADELYAMNFTPYSDPSLYPGTRGENEQDTFLNFMESYWQKDYTAAIKNFKLLSNIQQSNPNLLFLYANALAANHQYTRAKNIFVVVAQDNNSRYKKEAAFYEALMLLKLGKATEAKSIFSKIASDSRHPYFIKSQKLIKQI